MNIAADQKTRGRWRFRVLLVGLAIALPGLTAAEPLSALLPEPGSLPGECTAKPLEPGAPPFLTENPMTSSDRTFIQAFAGRLFASPETAAAIEAGLFGAYAGQHEVGIFAFRFGSAGDAAEAAKSMQAPEGRSEIVLGGSQLAMVWHDRRSTPCYRALVEHAKAALKPK